MSKEFWTIKELAERIPYSQNRLRQMCKEHKINAKKIGRKWLIPLDEVDRIKNGVQSQTSTMISQGKPTQEKEKLSVPTAAHIDHWNKLNHVANKLLLGLNFPPSRFVDRNQINDQRVEIQSAVYREPDIIIVQEWFLDGDKIHFDVQNHEMFKYLLSHLDAEFNKPQKFSDELAELQHTASMIYSEKEFYSKIRDHSLTEDLIQKLNSVVERGSYKGKCKICSHWDS